MSMLFHLDKCIGCHTCSVACKNLWTDRDGAEYMWWNNVETRPGTGYPTGWEDQDHYKGGWHRDKKGRLKLVLHSRAAVSPRRSTTRRCPSSRTTTTRSRSSTATCSLARTPTSSRPPCRSRRSPGKPLEIETGPNWDDDLGGSDIFAANDPSMDGVDERSCEPDGGDRAGGLQLPAADLQPLPQPVVSRGVPERRDLQAAEDGVVLVNEDKCRGWRMCVSGCPYKKVYYNWNTGKSEKCILCFPRMETGQAPACAHSCVGRIRYMGVLLYDADRIPSVAALPDDELLDAQLDMILDPSDPEVIAAARESGIDDGWLDAARRSPIYRFVKEWGMAFPLHPEYRTEAMMFYVPPLSPVMSTIEQNLVRLEIPEERRDFELLDELDKARLPSSTSPTCSRSAIPSRSAGCSGRCSRCAR